MTKRQRLIVLIAVLAVVHLVVGLSMLIRARDCDLETEGMYRYMYSDGQQDRTTRTVHIYYRDIMSGLGRGDWELIATLPCWQDEDADGNPYSDDWHCPLWASRVPLLRHYDGGPGWSVEFGAAAANEVGVSEISVSRAYDTDDPEICWHEWTDCNGADHPWCVLVGE